MTTKKVSQPEPLTVSEMGFLQKLAESKDPNARVHYYQFLSDKGYAYGAMALGVARNDTVLGRTANNFMKDFAVDMGKPVSALRERAIGRDLMRADFEARKALWEQDPKAVIKLKVRDIRDYHSRIFKNHGLAPEAWTAYLPTKLAGHEGEEALWQEMLSNARGDAWDQAKDGVGLLFDPFRLDRPWKEQEAYAGWFGDAGWAGTKAAWETAWDAQ
ncbi:hypothetical protein [Aestuariispira insulae]|uniref:Uncharacterized protein n=1 Tax=Aestuariispira insulae TaxID=1461337 RepID=A0A3D9HRQ0_9PROT|nr:hypothetical protein [Aestuariispira insulae]RED52172.1 hypothetical protein DFP90_102190 [Aestuariispira insulae]